MKQKKAGIYKGVSEPVYSDDILADQELQGADLATIGAWCGKVLPVMWRNRPKTGTVTDTVQGFARFWGCSVREVSRILGVVEARKIGTVSRDGHGNVTLTNRRLSRAHKAREDARLRKECERERRKGHGRVTGEKPPPPSPYPYPSPPSSSVPVDRGDSHPAPEPVISMNDDLAKRLANSYCSHSAKKGLRTKAIQSFREALEAGLNAGDIEAAIYDSDKLAPPWEIVQSMRTIKRPAPESFAERDKRELEEQLKGIH